uniref:Retrovirus-related Pol polyprotein from transposon TNT 1-94 n=1 Tax=Tanacetum cinerariifolium TaxID=118510 RepID=A0A6L2LI40_TANCI|nr:retrovirus-related Pol polyprotein from transposon TNT 1-94 [Tanacetum cinerariifolium]
MTSFDKIAHSNVKRPFERKPTAKNKVWSLTVRPKIPTIGLKVPTAKPTGAADKGNKGKAVKASAHWIWKPKKNSSGQGLNFNGVSVTFKKYHYIDTQGRLKKGIKREFSNARTPQQNDVAERRNRTLIEAARTMVLVIKPHNNTPYELFNERSPAIGFLRPFRCYVMILNTLDHLGKFDAKGDEGYFIGYSLSSKAFRVFNKRSKKIKENLHVDFLENKSIEKGTGLDWFFDIDTLTNFMNYVSVVVAGTSSTNISGRIKLSRATILGNVMSFENKLEDFFKDTSNAVSLNEVEANLSNMETAIQTKDVDEQSFIAMIHQKTNPDLIKYCLVSCFLSQEEPKKIVNALKDPSWVEAMQQELLQFKIQNVWVLVDYPSREEGIDYKEVFTPLAWIEAIRLFFVYASYMGFTVYQMDVKSAFLYGTSDEEVYVMQPPGFQDLDFPHRVYKVKKAMYELHQAPRAWYGTLSKSMIRSLMYITASRPDIMFVICACARHQVTPKECHLHAIKRIFRYLKGNPKLGLWYPKESPFDLVAYSDSDYGGANQDRKSTTGGCQFLGRRLISWQCKKHIIVATSTTEAEYVAATSGCGQVLWIQNKLLDYGDPVVNMCLNFLHGSDSEQRTYEFMHIYLASINETAFLTGDVSYEEAFPTDTSLDAGQHKENIAKTFAMPQEALPRVTSLGGDEGRGCSKHEGMDQGEDLLDRNKSADKGSDSIDEMSHVLGSLEAATILASGGLRLVFTTASLSVVTASIGVSPVVATTSGSFPTAVIFTTASVATPTTRVTRSSRGVVIGSSSLISANIPSISKKDKGKGKITEPEQPSKEKVLEQMSVQLARDLEAKFSQEDLIIREQAKRESKIARIHAEKELEMMIAELDRSNKMVAKHLAQIKKYQAQQNKPTTKTERRNFYMSILRSNAGWKAKDFKGMTFEQIEEKFIPVLGKMQDFVPRNSKLESERLKRPGIQLDKERIKKLKTAEALGTEPTQEQQSKEPKELFEEELKKMIELVPIEEMYIEALQETCSTTEVADEKAKELWVELKRLYELDSRDPLWELQSISVPNADAYIAKKFATIEDFALLYEDKIYSESKTRVSYI